MPMPLAYVVFEYRYSPDFGLMAPQPVQLFHKQAEADAFAHRRTAQMWLYIARLDKSGWEYGNHYMYYLDTLQSLGYRSDGMTEEQAAQLAEAVATDRSLHSFVFCKVKSVPVHGDPIPSGHTYLLADALLSDGGEYFRNTGKGGDKVIGLFISQEEAMAAKEDLNLKKIMEIIRRESIEVAAMYWQGAIFNIDDPAAYWSGVQDRLGVAEMRYLRSETSGAAILEILAELDKVFQSAHVEFYHITEMTAPQR